VKGRVAFGAVRVPPNVTRTDAMVGHRALYDFYGTSATRATTQRGGYAG
jgi:hypothetical protein